MDLNPQKLSEEDETFHDYKLAQEVSKNIVTVPIRSLFCWRQHYLVVTSALFNWKYVSRWKSHNFWTIYRREVVDHPFCCYKVALYNKLCLAPPSWWQFCWRQHFFSIFCAKNPEMTSRDVTWPDFHQTFTKCFLPLYLTFVQMWNQLHV